MRKTKEHIAIVGGGFSGAMTALHILRNCQTKAAVTLCEPRQLLGRGLAYSTSCDAHLLNVPASGMSAFVDNPDHFLRYAQNRDQSILSTAFVPRRIYGEYISAQLTNGLHSMLSGIVKFEHLEESVVDVTKVGEEYRLALASGNSFKADYVILALGNLGGRKPRWSESLSSSDTQYLHDPWQSGAIDSIGLEEDVLLVGTGLTAVDKIIELQKKGHRGKIYATSRHGLLPRSHLERLVGRTLPASAQSGSARGALRSLRQQISNTLRGGDSEDWRLIFDGLRSKTQNWWQTLSLEEQRRFLRHLRTYFEVHRHRMAPSVSQIVSGLIDSGQLQVFAARMIDCLEDHERLHVSLKKRGLQATTDLWVNKIVNCTGPQASIDAIDSPLLRRLVSNGIADRNSLGTGLAMTVTGQLLAPGGMPMSGLFALGPLLQGKLLESVAVPELRVQAEALARTLCELLRKHELNEETLPV